MGDNNANLNDKYLAMRNADSKRAIEWMSLYNSNPELAASLIPIFKMDEADSRFIIRTLNSLFDTLYFYKLAVKTPAKKKSSKEASTSTFVSV